MTTCSGSVVEGALILGTPFTRSKGVGDKIVCLCVCVCVCIIYDNQQQWVVGDSISPALFWSATIIFSPVKSSPWLLSLENRTRNWNPQKNCQQINSSGLCSQLFLFCEGAILIWPIMKWVWNIVHYIHSPLEAPLWTFSCKYYNSIHLFSLYIYMRVELWAKHMG